MTTTTRYYKQNKQYDMKQIRNIRSFVKPQETKKALRHEQAKRLDWAAEPAGDPPEPENVFLAGLRNHHLANTAYPIAHRKTIWQYRQSPERHGDLIKAALEVEPRMGLYVHIPFCEKRCAFCEYTVMDSHSGAMEDRYYQALMREFELYENLLGRSTKELVGLDIGGGTPSLIDPRYIGEIVERVARNFRLLPNFGISIETTPKIAAESRERLKMYKAFGIERISMGLQMVNPRLLHDYGRDSNKIGYNHQAVENIRAAGFRRFNIDLMYGFAKQSLEDFRRTLEYTIDLNPEYITLYRMRYKGTQVAGEAHDIELARIMEMYTLARELLIEAGYLANPGKNGFSRVAGDPGTSEYLTERVVNGAPYLGLGLGAQSFTNNLLAYNHGAATKQMQRYLEATDAGELPIQDLYHLPPSEGMGKMLSVSFYFGQIKLSAFRQRFGVELEEQFPDEVAYVLEQGLMEYHGDTLQLTPQGAKVVNGVIALFYSNRVKQHLLSLE